MKTILQNGRRHLLRFDKDEDVMMALTEYAKANNIAAAAFTGIGTATTIELGYFNVYIKNYRKKLFLDNMEIVSLTGNVAMSDGQPVIHAHGAFSNNEFTVFGGHVFKLIVLATCEIFLIVLDGEARRDMHQDFNLNLLT